MRGKRVGSPFQFSGKQMGFLFLLRKALCDGTPGTAGGKETCCGPGSPGGLGSPGGPSPVVLGDRREGGHDANSRGPGPDEVW